MAFHVVKFVKNVFTGDSAGEHLSANVAKVIGFVFISKS
jgi:hypothetical protein